MLVSGSWWEFLVVFSCTWLLTHGRGQETTAGNNTALCNDTKALDECWNKLPPIRDQGIPSNPKAVESACKTFDSGMKCVENWSKACLTKQDQEKVTSSVVGAQETYRFICSDKKFQNDFLKYADCYKKISHHWDECARKFIESLKRVDHSKDVRSLCCIRYRYLHCVASVAHHYCDANATRFLQRLAESLVRDNMRSYHPSQCINVGERNCSVESSSAQSSTKFLSTSSLLHTILSYPTKGLINSLNVLQNLAFNDITTFLCALSREFSPYFSYHLPVNLVEKNPAPVPTPLPHSAEVETAKTTTRRLTTVCTIPSAIRSTTMKSETSESLRKRGTSRQRVSNSRCCLYSLQAKKEGVKKGVMCKCESSFSKQSRVKVNSIKISTANAHT